MMRLFSDPAADPLAALEGIQRQVDLRWRPDPALYLVLAAKDYPDTPNRRRDPSLDRDGADPAVKVFHAATLPDGSELVVKGGRVFGVTALGADPGETGRRGYAEFDNIDWPQGFCRRDIDRKGPETVKPSR
jgi:phosphoribosylamine--glycine ligase